jgi:hypothetical protein
MDLYFCSFADKRFHKSLKRIQKQAISFNIFSDIWCYNEKKISKNFKVNLKEFLNPYTFYLCAWKPQLIIQCFEKMNDGEVLLYADSGCHLNPNARERLLEYVNIVVLSTSGILSTVLDDSMPEKNWTKGDTFDYFQCRYNEKITHTAQIQATAFLIQKRPSTQLFLKQWLKVFEDNPLLADRGTYIASNLPGYIEHRSDQSFFSILCKIYCVELVSAHEVQGSSNWEREMIKFPIWAKRDKEIDNGFWVHPTLGRLLLLFRQYWKGKLHSDI